MPIISKNNYFELALNNSVASWGFVNTITFVRKKKTDDSTQNQL